MKVIVCLDDKLGMIFNGRRQSRDRRVTEDVLRCTEGKRLYISAFSKKLFEGSEDAYILDEDMLSIAQSKEYCFVENMALEPYISRVEELIIYRWNRLYPADMRFDIDLGAEGFSLEDTVEFEGYSHEKITKEIYRR